VVVCGLAHTTMMWGSRALLFPLAGLGPYDYGLMRYRYPMEFALQAPNLATLLLLLHAWRMYRANRARELQAAQLEAELNRVRLERLEAQLQPHFLFNALNAVSSLMYHDPARADTMLGRLSDLLRLTFDGSLSPEVPLAQELEWLGWYLEIMQLRFGDRLSVLQRIQPETLVLLVPRLILQPLVENALKHGPAKHAGSATLEIRADLRGGRLRLAVLDDGPGVSDPAHAMRTGVGLANTAGRLGALYGDGAGLVLRNRPEGGAEAAMDLPARAAPTASGSRIPLEASEGVTR
jgi:LytS/YehU family sensor histidine kinase